MTSYTIAPKVDRSQLTATIRALLNTIAATGMETLSAARQNKIPITPALIDFFDSSRYSKELHKVCRQRVEVRHVPLALLVMEEAMQPNQPMRVRVEAARIMLDRGGFPARPAVEEGEYSEIKQMSRDELYAFVKAGEARLAEAEAQLAEGAKPVNAAPNGADDPQPIDESNE